MKIINVQQGTEEWHILRKNSIGSSVIPVIMGVSPYRSIVDVWREKTNRGSSQKSNLCMELGKKKEPKALKQLQKEHKEDYQPIVVQHGQYSFLHASLDAYSKLDNGIVEIKCPYSSKNQAIRAYEDLPKHWVMQALYQHIFVQTEKCAILIWDGKQADLIRIPLDKDLQDQMLEQARHFWEYNVVCDLAPEPKNGSKFFIEDAELEFSLATYSELQHQEKLIKGKKELVKNEILAFCNGTDSYETKDHNITLYTSTGGYDYKKMLSDNINLIKYKNPGKETYAIRAKKSSG